MNRDLPELESAKKSASSAQVPECLSALNARVLECLRTRSAQVLECSSVWVPKCLKCPPSALWVPSERTSTWVLLECLDVPLSLNVLPVSECIIRCDWNEKLSIKKYFIYMQKEKIRALIWKAFEISFRYLIFVKTESCFLCGHL